MAEVMGYCATASELRRMADKLDEDANKIERRLRACDDPVPSIAEAWGGQVVGLRKAAAKLRRRSNKLERGARL